MITTSHSRIPLLCLLLSSYHISPGWSKVPNQCGDMNNDQTSMKHLEPLFGQKVTIEHTAFNTTYTIGICTNVLDESREGEHAGVIEWGKGTNNKTIIVGRYNESTVMAGSHWIMLTYLDGEPYDSKCSQSSRHAAIMFVCNHDESGNTINKVRIINENLDRARDCYHLFEIEHCAACISDGCNAFFHIYSPGTIILIGLLSVMVTYLLFGWIYTRCIAGKKGWKQLPNSTLWQEIGHLQADGCAMVCRCGSRPEEEYYRVSGDNFHANEPSGSTSVLSDDEHMLPP